MALGGGPDKGVGTVVMTEVGGIVMTAVGTVEAAPNVGMSVGDVEGAPEATITHVCVEYALVLSEHELLEQVLTAHVALKGIVIVVEVPVQVALVPY